MTENKIVKFNMLEIHRPIPTYVINLKHRPDRKDYILGEFVGLEEFRVNIVEAIQHEVGALGLWKTIRHIILNLVDNSEEYILICEDDHQFTNHYSKELLFKSIAAARCFQGDILLGGVSSVHSLFQVHNSLLWIEGYTGNQFIIIFRRFFETLIRAEFLENDIAEYKISSLTTKQFLIFPFISTQKDFGYSDATPANNSVEKVSDFFVKSFHAVEYVLEGQNFYGYKKAAPFDNYESEIDMFVIPTYVINLPHRSERLLHIKEQFRNKIEFDVKYVDACKNEIGSVGLWNSIRKVIQMGINNDDDVLIICEDDHIFSDHYCKRMLFRNIVEAHEQGVDILSGGTSGGFGHALPIASNRFWVNHFLSTQFIIVYNKFFRKIMDAPFDDSITVDDCLSELTSNKMVIFPFISTQKDFGYSDVTPIHNEETGLVSRMFKNSARRLSLIDAAYQKHLFNGD